MLLKEFLAPFRVKKLQTGKAAPAALRFSRWSIRRRVCKKLLVQYVIYRQEPALSGSKDPVGHGLPGNGQTEPAQLLSLSVKRQRKHIFAVHDLLQ